MDPLPKIPKRRNPGWSATAVALDTSSTARGRRRPPENISTPSILRTEKNWLPFAQGSRRGRRCRRAGCARAFAEMASPHSARPRALPLCPRALGAKTFPSARRSGNHGQRQAHPREPRHRYSAGGAAFLLPRRLGAIARSRNFPSTNLAASSARSFPGIFRC